MESNSLLISVVIPTYNRPDKLITCLTSFNQQRLPRNQWEVIIIDDGSTCDLLSLIENISLDFQWRYVRQENAGPAVARNHGAELARGTFLAFTDDDCEPDGLWLLSIMNIIQPGVLLGGHTENKLKDNIYSESSQVLIDYLYEALSESHLKFFTSNNFAVDKKSFISSGSFNSKFPLAAGEDREFSIRYKKQGFELQYVPEALVFHSHDLSFKTFIRQHFNYGKSSYQFRTIMKRIGVSLYLDDTWFFIRLVYYPMKQKGFSVIKKVQLSILLVLSQVTYAFGALVEPIRNLIK